MHGRFSSPIDQQKKRLRDDMRAQRRAFADGDHAAKKLVDVFLQRVGLKAGAVVASYAAFGGELDPRFLAEALRLQGHRIALPVMAGKTSPLVFRVYESGDLLVRNAQRIFEPSAGAAVEPDVLLVPLLAFDSARRRLGYGGGYYDRTIAALRARKKVYAIGIGFAFQEVAELPEAGHDARLDAVVTNEGIL